MKQGAGELNVAMSDAVQSVKDRAPEFVPDFVKEGLGMVAEQSPEIALGSAAQLIPHPILRAGVMVGGPMLLSSLRAAADTDDTIATTASGLGMGASFTGAAALQNVVRGAGPLGKVAAGVIGGMGGDVIEIAGQPRGDKE